MNGLTHYSLQFLENMNIFAHIYLNKDVDTYYEYVDNIKITKSDQKLLKNISQSYFGIVFQGYGKSTKDNNKKYGTRGYLKIVVDKKMGNCLYEKCINNNYKVLNYKINQNIEKETNINDPFISVEWKKDENNQKKVVGRIWNDNDVDPLLMLINEHFTNYYSLSDNELYTDSHELYYMTIVDYEETSTDFLSRFYKFLVENYGKPNIKNYDKEKMSNYFGMTYLASRDEIYGEEEDCGCCPNCKREAQDTDDEKDDFYQNQDSDCDTDVE